MSRCARSIKLNESKTWNSYVCLILALLWPDDKTKHWLVTSPFISRLHSGWSVKTANLNQWKQPEPMSSDEHERILKVIEKADELEKAEMHRVGWVSLLRTLYFSAVWILLSYSLVWLPTERGRRVEEGKKVSLFDGLIIDFSEFQPEIDWLLKSFPSPFGVNPGLLIGSEKKVEVAFFSPLNFWLREARHYPVIKPPFCSCSIGFAQKGRD